jgi:basic membrane protein A
MKKTAVKLRSLQTVWFIIVPLLLGALSGCAEKPAEWVPGKPFKKEHIKIGIIHPNEINNISLYDWNHFEGTLEMQRNLDIADDQIIRRTNVFEENPGEVEAVIRECISEGACIIIAPSWNYMNVCEKLAEEFPQVVFAQGMGHKYNDRNFTNFFGRVYQAWYLSGIVAGLKTQTNKIGFVAAMGKDNTEVTGGINAFALGIESVNPAARVYVYVNHSWFDPLGETDAAEELIDRGCDVITQHCNTAYPQIAAQAAGVWGIGYNVDMRDCAPNAVLTSVLLRWGVYYTRLVQSVIDGSFTPAPYFGGIADGMVDIADLATEFIAPGTAEKVAEVRRSIIEGRFNVFDGELRTNDGRIIGTPGATLSDSEIIRDMKWYYQTVVEL